MYVSDSLSETETNCCITSDVKRNLIQQLAALMGHGRFVFCCTVEINIADDIDISVMPDGSILVSLIILCFNCLPCFGIKVH